VGMQRMGIRKNTVSKRGETRLDIGLDADLQEKLGRRRRRYPSRTKLGQEGEKKRHFP